MRIGLLTQKLEETELTDKEIEQGIKEMKRELLNFEVEGGYLFHLNRTHIHRYYQAKLKKIEEDYLLEKLKKVS
tara:strand:+ start:4150 stop:4371 length:222 start_codon:yes stop_codon:yes gene_type:complete